MMCSFPMCILFVIINEARRGALVGTVGLFNASPAFLKTEVARAVMFSAFQCTSATTNAVGLFFESIYVHLEVQIPM